MTTRPHSTPATFIVLDEDRNGCHITWRADDFQTPDGPGVAALDGRIVFYSIAEAVTSIRSKLPGRPVLVCPLTPQGMKLAEEARRNIDNVPTSDYQVWLEELTGQRHRWRIHWHGNPTGRHHTTTAATAEKAITRIRSQRPGAAIRAVKRTAAGHHDLAPLIDGHAIGIRDQMPADA